MYRYAATHSLVKEGGRAYTCRSLEGSRWVRVHVGVGVGVRVRIGVGTAIGVGVRVRVRAWMPRNAASHSLVNKGGRAYTCRSLV